MLGLETPFKKATNNLDLIRCNDALCQKLLKAMWGREKNIVISPFSMTSALGMVYEGARNVARQQVKDALYAPEDFGDCYLRCLEHLNTCVAPSGELNIANAIFPDMSLSVKETYEALVESRFLAEVLWIEFNKPDEAARLINKWVSSSTKERIPAIVDSNQLLNITRVVLVNAAYFKDEWETKFDERDTRPGTFYTPEGGVVAQMMETEREFFYAQNWEAEYIEIPYRGNFSMGVMLPRAEHRHPWSLTSFRNEMQPQMIKLRMPRMTLWCGYELEDHLAPMLPSLFNPEGAQDLSGISDEPLYIDKVIHKTFIEVGEKGTEAAASTAIMVMSGSLGPPPTVARVFNVNRPFTFTILERNTGMVLFVGKVENPLG